MNLVKQREYNNTFYNKNKERIQESITCECGGHYTYFHQWRHKQTKKHQNYIKSAENIKL